jgi:hypothetical protein
MQQPRKQLYQAQRPLPSNRRCNHACTSGGREERRFLAFRVETFYGTAVHFVSRLVLEYRGGIQSTETAEV